MRAFLHSQIGQQSIRPTLSIPLPFPSSVWPVVVQTDTPSFEGCGVILPVFAVRKENTCVCLLNTRFFAW